MDLFALFHAPDRLKCDEFHFVLESVHITSDVVLHQERFYLLVDERVAEQAYLQLQTYIQENTPEIIIARPLLPIKQGFMGAYFYAIVLIIFSLLQNTFALGFDWHQRGIADSFNIESGEWWRCITALTLHADSAHLAGNIGFGVLFALFVSQYIGSAAAWFSILMAGAVGNALNAYFHQNIHQSLGASTAVFAALGMLGIFALNHQSDNSHRYNKRRFRKWLPFIATIALLVFTGTAGERTDILAHLFGYFSGCLVALGWIIIGMPTYIAPKIKAALVISTLTIILFAWNLALR